MFSKRTKWYKLSVVDDRGVQSCIALSNYGFKFCSLRLRF